MLYLCEDCTFVFQLHTKIPGRGRKNIHCPACGEYFEVVRYRSERTSKATAKIRWTEEEIELLKKVQEGKLQAHQVAIRTGRTINAVIKRLGRLEG